MWCVAELDEEYIAPMEDVLAVYEKPLSAREPVVCIDEKPVISNRDFDFHFLKRRIKYSVPKPACPGLSDQVERRVSCLPHLINATPGLASEFDKFLCQLGITSSKDPSEYSRLLFLKRGQQFPQLRQISG